MYEMKAYASKLIKTYEKKENETRRVFRMTFKWRSGTTKKEHGTCCIYMNGRR